MEATLALAIVAVTFAVVAFVLVVAVGRLLRAVRELLGATEKSANPVFVADPPITIYRGGIVWVDEDREERTSGH